MKSIIQIAGLLVFTLSKHVAAFDTVYISGYLDTESSNNGDVHVFHIIPRMSPVDCMENCKLRKRCQFVNYFVRSNVCFLLGTNDGTTISASDVTTRLNNIPGYIFGIKNEWTLDEAIVCSTCSDLGPCPNAINGTNSTAGLQTCESSGCQDPSQQKTVVYGNQYVPGNWIKYSCSIDHNQYIFSTTTASCQLNGQWTETNFSCIFDCGIPTINNGQFLLTSGTEEGGTAILSCNPGHVFSGQSVIACTTSGWDGSGVCTYIDCGDPTPLYGTSNDTVYTYGSVIEVSCNPGLVMTGAPTIVCQADGFWSDSSTCDCDTLTINNGRANPPRKTEEKHVTVSCDPGHLLIGDSLINCTASGWDGNATCLYIDCGDPTPLYGTTDSSIYSYGSEVKVCCNTGLVITGTSRIECQDDGSWSGNPTCDCADLTINNGLYTPSYGSPGTYATLSCDPGHVLYGESLIYCTGSGWDGSATCTYIDCGDPTPLHGTVNSYVFTYGSVVDVSCNTGSVMTGTSPIVCQEDGSWSDSPTCGCASGQELFGNSCYVADERRQDWYQSKSACEGIGGHLMDVNSGEEQAYLKSLIQATDSYTPYWLGGNDFLAEGIFRWSDGTLISNGYTYWNNTQPDELNSGEDCVNIIPTGAFNYHWNDNRCSYQYPCICEIDL